MKDSFYRDLECVFIEFPKSGDFSSKVGKKDIFKPTVGKESLHEISNDYGVRVVNFAMFKNPTVKSTMFSHHNIPNLL
jgi:hypothetical protein